MNCEMIGCNFFVNEIGLEIFKRNEMFFLKKKKELFNSIRVYSHECRSQTNNRH